MGTRADFYIGTGLEAEWLGSVAWDGDEWLENETVALRQAKTEMEFREEVKQILISREDATRPEMGWPWPWTTSETTDCVYWWDDGWHGGEWGADQTWPDQTAIQKTALNERSGLIVFREVE